MVFQDSQMEATNFKEEELALAQCVLNATDGENNLAATRYKFTIVNIILAKIHNEDMMRSFIRLDCLPNTNVDESLKPKYLKMTRTEYDAYHEHRKKMECCLNQAARYMQRSPLAIMQLIRHPSIRRIGSCGCANHIRAVINDCVTACQEITDQFPPVIYKPRPCRLSERRLQFLARKKGNENDKH